MSLRNRAAAALLLVAFALPAGVWALGLYRNVSYVPPAPAVTR